MFQRVTKRYMWEISAGAAVLGVIGAAGMFLVEHYRQEKMRSAMAKDLARLDQELTKLRNELHQLQSQRSNERQIRTRRSNKLSIKKANSSQFSTTTDDYLSASNMDSSDLEFYDLSDDEVDIMNKSSSLESLLTELDAKLDLGDIEEVEETLQKLEDLCIEHPENPELLYRIEEVCETNCDILIAGNFNIDWKNDFYTSKLESITQGNSCFGVEVF